MHKREKKKQTETIVATQRRTKEYKKSDPGMLFHNVGSAIYNTFYRNSISAHFNLSFCRSLPTGTVNSLSAQVSTLPFYRVKKTHQAFGRMLMIRIECKLLCVSSLFSLRFFFLSVSRVLASLSPAPSCWTLPQTSTRDAVMLYTRPTCEAKSCECAPMMFTTLVM